VFDEKYYERSYSNYWVNPGEPRNFTVSLTLNSVKGRPHAPHAKSSSSSVLGLLFATEASAHGLWTEQRRGNIEVIYGHGAEDNAFKAQKISGAWAYDANGKMIPVTVKRLADHARLQPLKPPAVMAVALTMACGRRPLTRSGSTKVAARCLARSNRPRRSSTAWRFTSRGRSCPSWIK
jgi:hypothetical protein